MAENYRKKIILFSILVIFLISLTALLYFVSPEEIVDKIGVQNGYILAFIVSLFGGFSAAGSISFISLIITLVVGGMNPIYLGLVAGIGLSIGDMIMFYAGLKGRELVNEKWTERIDRIANFFEKRKWLEKTIPIITYLYIGFTPLPNDIILLFLAAIKYPAKKMNTIIVLGDMSFTLMVTILASKGITLIT